MFRLFLLASSALALAMRKAGGDQAEAVAAPYPSNCPCGQPCKMQGGGSGVCQTDGKTCAVNIVKPNCGDQTCKCGQPCTMSSGGSGVCQTDGHTCAVNILPPNCGGSGPCGTGQHSCPCATGHYCAQAGVACRSPNQACPARNPPCGPLQHSCPCATGHYCLRAGATCLAPNQPCPITLPCGPNQKMCLCATGHYCLLKTALCIPPTSKCPAAGHPPTPEPTPDCPHLPCAALTCPKAQQQMQYNHGCPTCPKCVPTPCPQVKCSQPVCNSGVVIPGPTINGCPGCPICGERLAPAHLNPGDPVEEGIIAEGQEGIIAVG